MSHPKVSVIIPVYNAEKYLRQCLDSVANQTLKDIEIICVNDGSADGSLEILREYEKKDKRFVIVNQENKGAGAARNNGLAYAKGQYLSFLDSDDYFEPSMLEEMSARCDRFGADICLCNANVIKDNESTGKNYIRLKPVEKLDVFSRKDVPAGILQISDPVAWNKLYRKSFVLESKIKFQTVKFSNDIFFSLMTIALADKIVYVNKKFVNYVVHDTATTALRKANKDISFIVNIYRDIAAALKDKGIFKEIQNSFYTKMMDSVSYSYGITDDALKSQAYTILKNKLTRAEFKQLNKRLGKWMPFYERIFSVRKENNRKVIRLFGFKINLKKRSSNSIDLQEAKNRGYKEFYFTYKSIGDSAALLYAASINYEKTGKKLLIGTNLPEIYENAPCVDLLDGFNFETIKNNKELANVLKANGIKPLFISSLTFFQDSSCKPEQKRRQWANTHFFARHCERAGLSGNVKIEPKIFLTDKEKKFGRFFKKTQIAVMSNGIEKYKTFPIEKMQEVIDKLKDRYDFIQVGAKDDVKLKNVKDARGKFSIRQLAGVLHNSDLFVGNIGGLMHLARAVGTRSVIAYSKAEPLNLASYPCNINVLAKNSCDICGKREKDPREFQCYDNYSCIKNISVEDMLKAVEKQMSPLAPRLPLETESINLTADKVQGLELFCVKTVKCIADSKFETRKSKFGGLYCEYKEPERKVFRILGLKIKIRNDRREKIKKSFKSFYESLFSIKKEAPRYIVTLLGLKLKSKSKKLEIKKSESALKNADNKYEYQKTDFKNEIDRIKKEMVLLQEQNELFKTQNELLKQLIREDYTQKHNNKIMSILHRITPQPALDYFLVHLTDECNLKCWGCDHFAPLANGGYLKIEDFEKDIAKMAELTNGNVARIGLMGGEPLLHPQASDFFGIARKYFPNTSIVLVTNGILLNQQTEKFWNECAKNNIRIENTVYPINIDRDKIKETAEKYDVSFSGYRNTADITKTSYHIPLSLEGKENGIWNFAHCFHANNCVMLKNGKIYPCTIAPNIEHFNKYFNEKIPLIERDAIDIHKAQNIRDILDFISKPIPFCKYCNIKKRSFNHPWKTSKKDISEWTIKEEN